MKTYIISKGLYRKKVQADYIKFQDGSTLFFNINVNEKHAHELIAVYPNEYKIILSC